MEPFIAMLNSIEWTDRNKASLALLELTGKRDPAILAMLRAEAFLSLVEMARWKSPGHAYSGFVLLGRVGGLAEDEIQAAWDGGYRETLIRKVMEKAKSN